MLIAAPHTSNWDLAFLLALAAGFDLRVSWMGKHGLFKPPFGWLMRRAGGIPIVRHQRGDMVAQAASRFADAEKLVLVVPAEGTRRRVSHWKSGFYHIARTAKVPIVLGYLDYPAAAAASAPRSRPPATSAQTWTRSEPSTPTRWEGSRTSSAT